MRIQFNTDKTIKGSDRAQEYFSEVILKELDRFQAHITTVEVHLSDQNGKKEGFNDIKCLLEARLEGKKPIAVSALANNVELALSGALGKLKASLDTILGRLKNH